MIRINQIKMPVSHTREAVMRKVAGILHIKEKDILSFQIIKKSIDARKKPEIFIIYVIDVEIENEERILRRVKGTQVQKAEVKSYSFPTHGKTPLCSRPVIIGTGPAGLFCGYFLALHGYRPILFERGKKVEARTKDIEEFWRNNNLHTDSNIQFGEGGAGTFSDGKLNTLIKDKSGRNKEVLRVLAESGAPEEILYESKPHIGTDILTSVVKNMREKIISLGGEVRFESKITDILIENGRVKEVVVNDKEHIKADIVVLAIGHSARDTFRMLYEHDVPMEAKAFAVGFRVEHPRRMINKMQYGMEENELLPSADYKLTAQTTEGRGVYSFCMCPGGYVVNASSENSRLAINGMSYSGRNGDNSNSAIIVAVTPEDFESEHPLAGITFQQKLEEKAYKVGQGKVPVETYGDFKNAVTGEDKQPSAIIREYPEFMPAIKGEYSFAYVHDILPKTLNGAFIEGMEQFGRVISGFNDSGVYVSGVESRTSSPVRIHRDETGQSSVKGLYPCGEGAGYAGGITSAAMDGILIAEKIAGEYYMK
ncbi:MAG: NAD(P)-binding protein [Lachnospiraceae bacterium]|nr:NAD(P)-binding protein [Lachnospiraceae bacterium]